MWVHYTRDSARADYAAAAFGTSLPLALTPALALALTLALT